MNALTELINAIFAPFVTFATKVPETLKSIIDNLLFDSVTVEGVTTKSVSTFALVAFCLMGIGMAVGLTKLIVNWIKNR